jgi:hypothetical protein
MPPKPRCCAARARGRVLGEPGVVHRPHRRVGRELPRRAAARSPRAARMRSVQRAQAAQRQPAVERRAGEPSALAHQPSCSPAPASLATTAPPTTSLWPFTYLVVECTTRSAPSASGFCSAGDRNVLSTANKAPARWLAREGRARSVSRSSGLLGVSAQTTAAAAPGRPRSAARRRAGRRRAPRSGPSCASASTSARCRRSRRAAPRAARRVAAGAAPA